ncbi:hypothetical protein MPC4_130067 [Methylocella tundrae]|uniref:Uncharacterized protein n=1 Tax=Methylocella tundrae TaxID=227605 RepID=A0A8B6M2H9_METTU|nr:hypothetical protein MPC1_3720004 [Methylocella tundrae]VTZ49046.1 hypothetical protein MPC4_130067 [Methylocella tundrae]
MAFCATRRHRAPQSSRVERLLRQNGITDALTFTLYRFYQLLVAR